MMTLEEFMDMHDACDEGRDWVLENNITTLQEAWDKTTPDYLIWIATRPGVLDERTLRLFAVWCARQVQHLMTDPRSISALDVAESHANGQATNEELAAARDAARGAACAAAGAAARGAACAAAGAAACAAARDAARDAAWDAQAEWLRKNAKPNFEKGMK